MTHLLRPMRYLRLVSLALLAACGWLESPTAVPVATSISVSPAVLNFNALGQDQGLTATVNDQNGSTMGAAMVDWITSDESVVSISSPGPEHYTRVTAVGGGTATIVASSHPVAISVPVTVVQEAVYLELSDTILSFSSLGEQSQLTAVAHDRNGNLIEDAAVVWSSSNTAVSTISTTGLVTSVGNGTAMITASSGIASESAVVTVTVSYGSAPINPMIKRRRYSAQ